MDLAREGEPVEADLKATLADLGGFVEKSKRNCFYPAKTID